MFVFFRCDEYVHLFGSLLNLGQHWSDWSSRHDCEKFRATRVFPGGMDTTSVVAHVHWRFQRSSVRMCASKLVFVNDSRATHQISEILCILRLTILSFGCVSFFFSGHYVIQHPSCMNDAQLWSGLVERPYDREHMWCDEVDGNVSVVNDKEKNTQL